MVFCELIESVFFIDSMTLKVWVGAIMMRRLDLGINSEK